MNVLQNFQAKTSNNSLEFHWNYGCRLVLALIFLYTVLLSSWIGDDAAITFRQIWNFITGHGIVFNYESRVQAFTHPLWFLVLSGFSYITGELYLTTSIVSVSISILSVLILLCMELQTDGRVIFVPITALLLFSWSFVDYMTSGLENPLSNLLVSLLLLIIGLNNWHKHYTLIFFILALTVLNRIDYVILFFPLIVYQAISARNFTYLIKCTIPGLFVLILWFLFATYYFGSPFPNTYFAKLSSEFSRSEYLVRGIEYVFALVQDPVTILILLLGMIVSLLSLNKVLISLVIGQLFYILYIIYIGGDFMQGRYFAILTLLSLGETIIGFSLLKKFSFRAKNLFLSSLIFLLLLGNFVMTYPFNYDREYIHRKPLFKSVSEREYNFLTDERGTHYNRTGLFSIQRNSWPVIVNYPNFPPQKYKILCGWLGRFSTGIKNTYFVDACGLSDPLLSRIPAVKIKDWVIGHQIRKVPTDYGEFLIKNTAQLPDQDLKPLLDDIVLVTNGDLINFERFKAIWRLNSGYYSNLDFSVYSDKDIWIPSTSKYEFIEIKNWALGLENTEFYSNLMIQSDRSIEVSSLIFTFDKSHEYEITINDKFTFLVSQMDFSESTIINLAEPTQLKSVKIKAIKGRFKHRVSNSVKIKLNN